MTYGKQQKSARLIQLVNVNQKMSKLIQTIYFISDLKLILDDRDCHKKMKLAPKYASSKEITIHSGFFLLLPPPPPPPFKCACFKHQRSRPAKGRKIN